MPQIPVALAERSIPGQTGSPFKSGDDYVGAALQKSGQQVEHVANRFLLEQKRLDEKMKIAEQHVEAAKHENYLRTWVDGKVTGLSQRQDYENFDADADKDIDELTGYVGKIADPQVKLAVEAAAQSYFHQYKSAVNVKKAAVITDRGKAELDKNLGYDLQDFVSGSSEPRMNADGTPALSERDTIKEKMKSKITSAAQAGIIKQTDAVDRIQKLDSVTDEFYARALINSDPGRALQEIPNLRNIDPIKQQAMLSTAVVKIEQRDRQAEKVFKQAQEEAEQQVMDRILAGDQLGATDLLTSYGKNRMLTPEKRRTLKAEIDAVGKREAKSDPTAFHDLEQNVLLGKATIRDVLNAQDVSVADKNKLIKLYKDEKDPRKSYDYTSAMTSAHNDIITTGVMAALDPDQQSRFTAYKRAAEKDAQAGGDPWAFYDRNAWKYMGGVPKTKYGTPRTIEDVNAAKAQLRADVTGGKIKPGPAGLEAEKLEKATEFFLKQKKATTNAGNK